MCAINISNYFNSIAFKEKVVLPKIRIFYFYISFKFLHPFFCKLPLHPQKFTPFRHCHIQVDITSILVVCSFWYTLMCAINISNYFNSIAFKEKVVLPKIRIFYFYISFKFLHPFFCKLPLHPQKFTPFRHCHIQVDITSILVVCSF